MNKQIIFGNSKGIILNDIKLKTELIEYLFNSTDSSKFRYVMLNNIQKLNFLKDNPHYVTPNFRGLNYITIFKKINNKNYCIFLDKRKMSYHKNQIDLNKLQFIRVRVNVSDSIFRGTILDTKLIRKNSRYIVLVKDCYQLMGNSLIEMEMNNKMKHLNSIIKNQFKKDFSDNFKIKINKYYEYSDLKNLIENIIPKCDIKVLGITFYPKYSGITVIYLDKKQQKVDIEGTSSTIDNKSYHIIYNLIDFLKSRNYSYENTGKKRRLWIRRTNTSDVYDVLEKSDSNRLGIALIPNLKISHLCSENVKNEAVNFLCVFNKKHNKWIPISKE